MATSNKAIPLVLIGIAALAVIAYFGMNTGPDEVAGTVAPAERYRAEQMSEDDINLGDQSVQDFMQSDLFAKLTTTVKAVITVTTIVVTRPSRIEPANSITNAGVTVVVMRVRSPARDRGVSRTTSST